MLMWSFLGPGYKPGMYPDIVNLTVQHHQLSLRIVHQPVIRRSPTPQSHHPTEVHQRSQVAGHKGSEPTNQKDKSKGDEA